MQMGPLRWLFCDVFAFLKSSVPWRWEPSKVLGAEVFQVVPIMGETSSTFSAGMDTGLVSTL